MKLWDNVRILDEQARRAIESNREDEKGEPVVAE